MDNILNAEASTYDYKKTEKFNQHKDKLYFPTSIGYYLEWLSDKLSSNFLDDYQRDFETLRQEISMKHESHGRYTDSFAHQIIAFNFYMAYGKERGFITPEQCVQNCNKSKEIFLELLNDQSETIFDSNIELFLKGLKEVIIAGKVVVREMIHPMLNFDQSIYGVVTMEKKQEVLKLDWDNVYEIVSQHIIDSQKNRNTFIGAKKLAKLLDEYNLICFNENGSTTPLKAWNNNQIERCRVINFRTDNIPEVMDVIHRLNDARNLMIDELAKDDKKKSYQEYLEECDEREANEDVENSEYDMQDEMDELESQNNRKPYVFSNVFGKHSDT